VQWKNTLSIVYPTRTGLSRCLKDFVRQKHEKFTIIWSDFKTAKNIQTSFLQVLLSIKRRVFLNIVFMWEDMEFILLT
jgi:hypothetical protein